MTVFERIENLRKSQNISDYFGVSMKYLMTGTEGDSIPEDFEITNDIIEFARDINFQMILDVYKSKNKEQLINYAKFLKEQL